MCYGYWPSKEEGAKEEEVTHGEFTITAGNVKYGNIIQRNFTLVCNKMVCVAKRVPSVVGILGV